ncbi:unknown [Corallococcus sp. CAG:1435]|nr:unknown [Corallococcus sp. CAG:1435]
MRKNICTVRFFAQNLSCVTVLDAKFRLRVQVFDTKKTICTRFSGHCKNSFAPSFRISFYLKIYFWIDVCNAFSNNRTASEMSILPLPPTYAYSVSSKFTHSVHYSGVCLFNNGGIGKKVNDGIFPFYVFGVTNVNFCRFTCKFFPKRLFRKPLILFAPLQVLKINRKARTKVPSFERSANCPLPAICAQNKLLAPKTQKIPEKIGDFCLIQE